MSKPDWRSLVLKVGILRERAPDEGRLILWLPAGKEDGFHYWERVSTVPRAEVRVAQGICTLAATSIRLRQQQRGIVGRLLGRLRRPTAEQSWVVPNGAVAQPCGERAAELLLAWAEDEASPLDLGHVQARWPSSTHLQQLGNNLFLVAAAGPAAPASGDAEQAQTGDPPRAVAERLLAAARQAGDRRAEASALTDLGVLWLREGDASQATPVLEEALTQARRLGQRTTEQDALSHLGLAAIVLGQRQRGLELCQESLRAARGAADVIAQKTALEYLGHAYSLLREPAEALVNYEQALALARAVGDKQHKADLLWHAAVQHAELGRPDQAVGMGRQAVDVLRELGNPQAGHLAGELQKYRLVVASPAAGRGGEAMLPKALFGGPIVVSAGGGERGSEPTITPPCLLRLALSAAKSATRFLGSGLQTVSVEARQARLRVCAGCEHHTGLRCRVCGCFTSAKTWLPHEHCPLGKWGS